MSIYKDYMDSFTAGEQLQRKALDKLSGIPGEQDRASVFDRITRFSVFKRAPAWVRAACLAVLVCAALGATAYAVYQSVAWTPAEGIVDTGAHFVLIPDNNYTMLREGSSLTETIVMYEKSNTGSLPVMDDDTAAIVRDQLKGRVFTGSGEPFELLVQVPGGYQADDGGFTLYDNGGEEIIKIGLATVDADGDGAQQKLVTVFNAADVIQHNFAAYDEASAFLGSDFRLPAVNDEYLDPPEFQLFRQGMNGRIMVPSDYVLVSYSGGSLGLAYAVYPIRSESGVARYINVPEDKVFEGVVAGVTVYKIADPSVNTFIWEFEGLTYVLMHGAGEPDAFITGLFTDGQIEEIIRSMIE